MHDYGLNHKVKGLVEKNGWLHYQLQVHGTPLYGALHLRDTLKNRTKALEIINQIRHDARNGIHNKNLKPILFGNACASYLKSLAADQEISKNTKKRYRSSIKIFNEFMDGVFPNTFVHQIHAPHFEEFRDERYDQAEIAPVTLRHDLMAMRCFFQWAKRREHVLLSPFETEDIPMPSDKDSLTSYIIGVKDEQRYFKAAAANMTRYGNLHDSCLLCVEHGMRPGEIRQLEVRGFDRKRRDVQIFSGKSYAAKRLIPLKTRSLEVLTRRAQQAEKLGSRWLFPADSNPKEHIGPLHKQHYEILEQTDLLFRLYDYRHTFATRAALRGMNPHTLAYLLGHANTNVLKRYVHPQHEDARLNMQQHDLLDQAMYEKEEEEWLTRLQGMAAHV